MNPVGDPHAETAALDDYREDTWDIEVDAEDLEGVHTPKLIVAIRTASGDTEALRVIDEPRPGQWTLIKQ